MWRQQDLGEVMGKRIVVTHPLGISKSVKGQFSSILQSWDAYQRTHLEALWLD